MINNGKLVSQTLFITGASRGIGKAIAIKAARDGANVVIAAKTSEPHPKLPGTIYTAAEEVEAAGGKCLPCIVDVRDEKQVISAVEEAVKKFGGIDIVINNASAISLTGTINTEMKRYDLMHQINARGTFLVSKVCLPYLKNSKNPHIINLSPPLNMSPHWFRNHVAYTMAKYGMSMCVLGMADEFKEDGIAVNALWPKTGIQTAAMDMLGGPESGRHLRKPEIVADAAYAIMLKDPKTFTGKFVIDEDILRECGIQDFTQYAVDPSNNDNLMPDFFLDYNPEEVGQKFRVSTENKSDNQIEKIFNVIRHSMAPELVSKTNAIFQFEVKGAEGGVWFIDLKNGNGAAGKGKPASNPDAVLSMDAADFHKMFSGKLKPAAAFMSGKLKITGNMQKALTLEKLLGQLKSKL